MIRMKKNNLAGEAAYQDKMQLFRELVALQQRMDDELDLEEVYFR